MNTVGYLSVDIDEYRQWYNENAFSWIEGKWTDVIYQLYTHDSDGKTKYYQSWEEFSVGVSYNKGDNDEYIQNKERDFNYRKSRYMNYVADRVYFCEKYNQRINVVEVHDLFYLVRFGKVFYMFPTSADGLTYTPLTDYDYLYGKEMDKITCISSSQSMSQLSCINTIQSDYDSLKCDEKSLESELEDIKSGKHDELSELQAQLEKIQNEMEVKKQALLAELEKKQEELNIQKRKLEGQIFMLETQIYGIRCFTGEVVDFVKLRSGKRCSVDTPLILHQKLRYIDEEMGRLCALYNLDFNDCKYFEDYISSSKEAFEIFCPTVKCVSLVKISKDNKVYGFHAMYDNMLKAYDVEHGDTIGILIRDDENLYMCWTDEDRICIKDDLFYTPSVREEIPYDGRTVMSDSDKHIALNEACSRYFLFNILQGCIDAPNGNAKIITLPEGTKCMPANQYVVYSSADGWIDSDKYPNLGSLIEKCNKHTKLGDNVLLTMGLCADRDCKYVSYSNDRGRGYKNRTSNVHASDGSIHRINIIDYNDSYLYYDTGLTKVEDYYVYENRTTVTRQREVKVDYKLMFDNDDTKSTMIDRLQRSIRRDKLSIDIDESKIEWHIYDNYYISLLKDDSDTIWTSMYSYHERQRESRANFQIYENEYINLELFNSAWIEYFIDSKKTSGVVIGSKSVNYAYLIKYLNIAMKHIKEREKHEIALLMEAGFRDFDKVDWRDMLSKYKIETGRHILKPRWAKQFASQLNDKLKGVK